VDHVQGAALERGASAAREDSQGDCIVRGGGGNAVFGGWRVVGQGHVP